MKILISTVILIFTINSNLAFSIPLNSHTVGASWQCNYGYKKQGQQCNKIYIPPNASLKGSGWVCRPGFKRIGQQCNKTNEAPKHSLNLDTANKLYDAGKYNESINVYKALANKGNKEAQFFLGVIYSVGDKVTSINHSLAFRWFKKAANNGHSEAQIELSHAYSEGIGVLKNAQKAFYWLSKPAAQGNAEAQEQLANYHALGFGTLKDYNQAFRWYLKAAQQGSKSAQYFVAKFYCIGIGIAQKNLYKCSEWAKKSYDNGYTEASILWEEYDLWKYQ